MISGVFCCQSVLAHTHPDLTKNRPVLFCARFYSPKNLLDRFGAS